MRKMSLDVGTRTIGIAVSDLLALLSSLRSTRLIPWLWAIPRT